MVRSNPSLSMILRWNLSYCKWYKFLYRFSDESHLAHQGTGLYKTDVPHLWWHLSAPCLQQTFWFVREAGGLVRKSYWCRKTPFHLHSLPPPRPPPYLWTSMSCRKDDPLAMGYCGFHGSYKYYLGKQLTLAGIFSLYFLMSWARCTSISYIATPITAQKFPFGFLMGAFLTQPESYAYAWREVTANCQSIGCALGLLAWSCCEQRPVCHGSRYSPSTFLALCEW